MAMVACITPYDASGDLQGLTNLLVVEGTISGGEDGTTIRLSRTVPVGQSYTYTPETGATLWVEAERTGQRTDLRESGNGNYQAVLTLDVNDRYRLSIQTRDRTLYQSEYTAVLDAPAIDSVYWDRDGDAGVRIYVDTHDPQNRTQYYRWEFDEDWEFHSYYESKLDYDWATGEYFDRPADQGVYYCWQQAASNTIVTGTTDKLVENVVSRKKVHTIKYRDWRLSYIYRIRVRQYGLTKEAYEYWQTLEKNTEGLGDLFGPQPSNMTSNIVCASDPSTRVIGYISAGIPTTKDRYIENTEVAPWVPADTIADLQIVPKDTLNLQPISDSIEVLLEAGYLLISWIHPVPGSDEVDLYYAPRVCSDCLIKGNKNRPSDWINEHQ